MNIRSPRGVCKLLLVPCFAIGITGPLKASTDLDFLKVHPTQMTVFSLENLSTLALSNAHSLAYVKMYTATGKTHTAAMLGRGLYYFPIFERYLSAEQMPLELKYLSMVESELRTDVESASGAAGLWQFMPATARNYGLHIEGWRDERRDPVAATAAAVSYLKALYTEFGNWELVIGAYNCGSGCMRKAVRRAKSTDFAKVRQHLPVQTQQYLAKFYAAAYISHHFQDFQIIPKLPSALAGGTTQITVSAVTSFRELARICRISVGKISRLNPQYIQGVWPKGTALSMVLPEEPARRYLAYFNQLPQSIDVLPEEALATPESGFLSITEPYRILNSLVTNLGGQAPSPERVLASRRYYSKYFLRGEA